MRLKKLSLRQFRNISELELDPDNILNLFVGDNGQGKTSILEAIFYLSTLKSFRPGKTADLVQSGKTEFQIETSLTHREERNTVSLKVRSQLDSRKVFVNNKAVPSSKFISQMRVVVFSPDSLAAIKYGPDLRRELIDQAVFQISTQAAQAQNDYIRALRQRNSCLKQMKSGVLTLSQGRNVLESLTPGFVRLASEVIFYRLEFLESVEKAMVEILSQIMGTGTQVKIVYQSDEKPWLDRGYSAIQERLESELRDPGKMSTEESLGLTLVGPHRHDLRFIFNETDSRIYCSQGQQRALILSFKIAEIVYHSKVFDSFPLLLLDDVLSEFDEKKRRFLVDFLRTNEAQTFLTTTDQMHVLDYSAIFHIDAGRIIRQEKSNELNK